MKRILCAGLICLGLFAGSTQVYAAQKAKKMEMSRGDVKIIEATETIRYLSQKMAKEYLFLLTYPKSLKIKRSLHETLEKLGQSLQDIAAVTKDEDTNNILEFLAYSKEEILTLLKKKPNNERAVLMMDYSETLLEGADSIGRTYAYAFSKEEEMLVASKNVKYLLERITKYYMALYHGYSSENNKANLDSSVKELMGYLAKLNSYDYPEEVAKARHKVDIVWERDKGILKRIDHFFIPNLLFDSVVYLEEKIDILALYHSQNL
jgi:hypothetical protein